ncbi:zinc finger, CCCH type domain-containing protein [Cryptosporidium serpentis]
MRGRWKGGKGIHSNPSSSQGSVKVLEICRHFVLQGNCKFGSSCNFSHILRQVSHVPRAHNGGIRCAITLPLATGELELFTGGCDGKLKRWKITPVEKTCNNEAFRNSGQRRPHNYNSGKYQGIDYSGATMLSVKLESSIDCNAEVCSCLIYGDVMFCGLINGIIRAFHRPTGTHMDLLGHNQEIHQLLIIDNILVSACWGGKILFWKFDSSTGIFNISAQIQVKEHIKCLRYFPYNKINNSNLGQNIGQENCSHCLWICGGGFIQIVDLLSFQVIREISLDGGPVMSVLEYENHLVLCSLQGIIRVLSSTGDETFRKSLGSPILCMDGSNIAAGKHLLMMGQQSGHLRCITLPLFDNILEFHTPDARSEIRLVTNLGGSPGIFMTAQWDGTLNFYQWCSPTGSQATKHFTI